MLGRHIVSYLPSQMLPALLAMVLLTVYTHVMSPEEYGYYVLIINGHLLFVMVGFSWLHNVVLRLGPKADRENYRDALRTASYLIFGVISLIALFIVLGATPFTVPKGIGWIVWFAFGLGVSRGLLTLVECWHRSALQINRFNLLECGQAIGGLIGGIGLVYYFQMGAEGGAIGMMLGIILMLVVDRHQILTGKLSHVGMPVIREVLRMGAPLIFSSLLVYTFTSIDRFMLGYFKDASAVGIYAAGYTLVDRIMQVLFLVIAMASYSLTVHRLEHEGVEAARAQTYKNGIGILGLALPACVGLIFCAPQLAYVVIGEEFRAGAITVMPWITIASFFYGLTVHYFDHAFFLAKKPHMFVFTQGPCAALYVVLNFILIPRYGAVGAAYATLASYLLLLTLSITLGRRVFRIHFPFGPALRIVAASGFMGLVLEAIPFPLSLLGLLAMAAVGGISYGVAVLAFNVEGVRPALRHGIRLIQTRLE